MITLLKLNENLPEPPPYLTPANHLFYHYTNTERPHVSVAGKPTSSFQSQNIKGFTLQEHQINKFWYFLFFHFFFTFFMLKVILNRLKPEAKKVISEEQARFKSGRSTENKSIFNLRSLCEKYLQHQQNLHYVFIDFKKAFVRLWDTALYGPPCGSKILMEI